MELAEEVAVACPNIDGAEHVDAALVAIPKIGPVDTWVLFTCPNKDA